MTRTARPNIWTPWGSAQTVDRLAPGIDFVSTASHGGIRLDAAHAAAISERFPVAVHDAAEGPQGIWWEEDCAYHWPCIAFYEQIRQAVRHPRRECEEKAAIWHPAAAYAHLGAPGPAAYAAALAQALNDRNDIGIDTRWPKLRARFGTVTRYAAHCTGGQDGIPGTRSGLAAHCIEAGRFHVGFVAPEQPETIYLYPDLAEDADCPFVRGLWRECRRAFRELRTYGRRYTDRPPIRQARETIGATTDAPDLGGSFDGHCVTSDADPGL